MFTSPAKHRKPTKQIKKEIEHTDFQLIKNLSGSLLPLAFRQWRLYSSRPLPPAISLHLLLRETTRVSLTIQVVQEIQLDLLVLRGLAQAIMSLRFLQEILSLERYGGG